MKNSKAKKREEVFIRSDGWVFSKDGLARLKAGGHKGFERFKASTEAKFGGEWHRLCNPLDKEAAAALKAVKGFVERGEFLSKAVVAEAKARKRGGAKPFRGSTDEPAEFMRMTFTGEAFDVVRRMGNPEFREFVSSAILKAAKKN